MVREDMVFAGQNLVSREEVIGFIASAAQKAGLLSNKADFIAAVFRREQEISTSIGHGIAIPHGKTEAVREAFISYVGVAEAFEWDPVTKDLVKGVFLIGVPEKNTDKIHLKAISEISKKLINDEFRTQLFLCTQGKEAFELLDAINAGIQGK